MADPRRNGAVKNVQAERRLVSDWVQARHPDDYTEIHVRLGSLPLDLPTSNLSPEEQRMLHGALARWADAIVFTQDRVRLVEAKMVAHPHALGQLLLYERI